MPRGPKRASATTRKPKANRSSARAKDAQTHALVGPRTPGRSAKGGDDEARLVDLVFSWIADQILVGSLGPGQWISETSIADALNVSRSPVHQALQVLSALHVVEVTPRRGTMVADPSWTEVADLYKARGFLSGQIASLAAKNCTESTGRRLLDLSALVAKAAGNNRAYFQATASFWDALSEIGGNVVLAQMAEALWIRSIPVRGIILAVPGAQEYNSTLIEAVAQGVANRNGRVARAAAVKLHEEMEKIALESCFLPSDAPYGERAWRRRPVSSNERN